MDPIFISPFKILSVIGIVISVLVLYYLYSKTKEQIALIEKGIVPNSFDLNYSKLTNLRNGIIMISFGISLVIGSILDHYIFEDIGSVLTYIISVFIIGGSGFLVYYFILEKHSDL